MPRLPLGRRPEAVGTGYGAVDGGATPGRQTQYGQATTTPWLDDACSLVEAFRARQLSPLEALDACIEAIGRSPLNAFSHTDFERARDDGSGRGRVASLRRGPVRRQGARARRPVALHRRLDDLQGPGVGL